MYWLYTTDALHQDGHMSLLPSLPCPCPLCQTTLHWSTVVKELKRRAVVLERVETERRRRHVQERMQQRLEAVAPRKRPPGLRTRLDNHHPVCSGKRARSMQQGEESFIASLPSESQVTERKESASPPPPDTTNLSELTSLTLTTIDDIDAWLMQ
ncbi:hypothetical protein AGDE_15237 [Angomonas deanei]|uniref:Uncharacterized protein n=1 Tax=Angomonas deanei TaxID=59799 RepID=A0A7G2CGI1_9TRYP|nr:hypothetical protein AGDE_15237 [Angomonas deanei]CAD2217302.1 hypothetical protein, conserved [Angomonas deanei]|eukprot:EPY19433.1 hypothetical protein AGDE_15237 [Angomonas deanei]